MNYPTNKFYNRIFLENALKKFTFLGLVRDDGDPSRMADDTIAMVKSTRNISSDVTRPSWFPPAMCSSLTDLNAQRINICQNVDPTLVDEACLGQLPPELRPASDEDKFSMIRTCMGRDCVYTVTPTGQTACELGSFFFARLDQLLTFRDMNEFDVDIKVTPSARNRDCSVANVCAIQGEETLCPGDLQTCHLSETSTTGCSVTRT